MGHIKDIANQGNIQTFPSSTFEIAGEVPASQCSEAKIEGDHGETTAGLKTLFDFNKFTGWNLIGKSCYIISPIPNSGPYNITNHTDHQLTLHRVTTATSTDNVYFIENGGELILTRNIQSFAQFIHAAGYAHTIKGAKLYTNIPLDELAKACSIRFDPLT